ncbi:hypothetical protein D6783_05740 [Candidatus Woesearchaeota archaeon]|nr:MAG: hypothetical protein D6783_05740 [Candidatus Woesearchaeota archaeon]
MEGAGDHRPNNTTQNTPQGTQNTSQDIQTSKTAATTPPRKKDAAQHPPGEEDARWNVEDILHGKSPEELREELQRLVTEFCTHQGKLDGMPPSALRELFDLKERILVASSRLESYYTLRFCEDTRNAKIRAQKNNTDQFLTHLANNLLFFPLWLTHLPNEEADQYLASPELQPYHHYIKTLRKQKPYLKTEDVEQVINTKNSTGSEALTKLYNIITSNLTFPFQGRNITAEEIKAHFQNQDPAARAEAYSSYLTGIGKESIILSEIYTSIIQDWVNEELTLRGHQTPISPRNLANDLPDEAVNTLIATVRKHSSVFIPYFQLKHELNRKAGQTYPYSREHLYAPYAHAPKKTYPFSNAKSIAFETYNSFDKRFADAARRIFNERHIDAHPRPGKRGGAFCSAIDTATTPYILLNHTGTFNDLFTLVHELGHGIHDIFAMKQNNLVYHPPLPLAETASTFGELLLSEKILAESTSREERITALIHLIDGFWQTIVRQAYFIIFEQQAHLRIQKGATKDELEELYLALLKEQVGDMNIPDYFKHEWNAIPHIYETPFYCYAYAWGNLLVLSLYTQYKKQGRPFIDAYHSFLSAGGSKAPLDLLNDMGFDATKPSFWEDGITTIKSYIAQLEHIA